MTGLTTHQAFEYLTKQRKLSGVLGLSPNTWKVMRQRFIRGELGTDTMCKILQRAGFVVEQEQMWELKK